MANSTAVVTERSALETILSLLSLLYVCGGTLAGFYVSGYIGAIIAVVANYASPGGIPDLVYALIFIITMSIGTVMAMRAITNTRFAARACAILENMNDFHDYNCDW